MSRDPTDHRLDPRATVRLRVVAFGAGPGQADLEMVTRNLSAGGALCESPVPVPLAAPLTTRIDLTDEAGAAHPVVVEALVLRVEGGGPCLVALHFVDPPARVLEHLKGFVARTVRAAP
jgi:hypothetical protein